MINGKFYTGLPPKMVERQCATGHNRQESHFFWPDDSQVDSAVETRVKRRGSLQLETGRGTNKSLPQAQRLSSVQDTAAAPEVDTRQMFHKEFAKSSIQFYDNLQPVNSNISSRLRSRREVTPKLTDVQPQFRLQDMPEADPSAAKRKQAYSSTIQFYDYVNPNEADATQNNVRRPKMDMNNKREVELNTKNSPKLQVKHNVRHLNVEPPPVRGITKKPLNAGPQHWEQQYEQEPYESFQRQPKKILKPQRNNQPWLEDNNNESLLMEYMDSGMRQLRLRSPAPTKKHVTYNEQAAEYEYYDDRDGDRDRGRSEPRQLLPNMRTGSGQQQIQPQPPSPYAATGRDTKPLNNYNKTTHNNYNDYNNSSSSNNSKRSRKILPKLPELTTTATTSTTTATRTMRTQRFDDTPATVAPAEASQPLSPSDPRKHLRSSLCFNGDALVVDVGAAAAAQSTSAVALARRSSAGQRVSVGLPD